MALTDVRKNLIIIAINMHNAEHLKVLIEIASIEILNNQLRLNEQIQINPTIIDNIVTQNIEKKPEEIIRLTSTLSLAEKALTKLFLIPFPIPKSKFKNQISTESNVYHTPSITLLSKYFIKAGVVKKETTKAAPFIKKAKKVFFNIILLFEDKFFSFSHNFIKIPKNC